MKPTRPLSSRRHFLASFTSALSLGGVLAAGLSLAGAPTAQAEAYGRVYRIEATLAPTALVASPVTGDASKASAEAQKPVTITIKVNPSDRRGSKSLSVSQGTNGWKIDSYTLHVYLKPGPDGGSDDGTLHYLLLANVSHDVGDHLKDIYARSHGDIPLKYGNGQIKLTTSKYFVGDMTVRLVGPDAGW